MGIFRYCILLLTCIVPLHVFAATERTIEVNVSYTPPKNSSLSHVGYKLYQEGQEICQADTSLPVTCTFVTEDGTYNFAITALYNDGSESLPSPDFPFTIGDSSSVPDTPTNETEDDAPNAGEEPADSTAPEGSHKICYTIEDQNTSQDISGYRMYLNDYLLCDIPSPSTSTLCCYADPLTTTMTFAVSHYDAAGTESDKSNFLTLDPAEFANLFRTTALTFNWEYTDGETNAGGFQLYFNDVVLCETSVSTARTITCEATGLARENVFKIAAIDSTGTATLFSNLIVYSYSTSNTAEDTTTEPSDTSELQALLTSTPGSGTAPLTVAFDATASTGDISSYNWNFGDGSSATGATVTHAYSSVGIYTASLTITDTSSTSHTTDVEITVEESTTPTNELPVAVVASSTALGDAPLSVTFDGSASTGRSTLNYRWEYGDGSIGSGIITAHIFPTAGSYTAQLKVTDSEGLTDTASTPVLVTESETMNTAPTAAISATPTSGETPLAVTFNGSGSTDADGNIELYKWIFGDGSVGTGATVIHTYTAEGLYTATLQVQDNLGAWSSTVSKTVTATSEVTNESLIYEVGEVEITTDWIRVQLESTFSAPVVIAGPPTRNNNEPAFVRIRNLSADSFEIRLQEWDYQDGTHPTELVNFIVAEQGIITLGDGAQLEIGQFTGSSVGKTVTFEQNFSDDPVVLTSVLTANDLSPVIDHVENISKKGFVYTLDPGSVDTNGYREETVGYIAWSQSKGNEAGMSYEAAIIPRVSKKGKATNFNTKFVDLPFIFAGIQNRSSSNSSILRVSELTAADVTLSLTEENPTNRRFIFIKEDAGYIAIGATTIQESSSADAIAEDSTDLKKIIFTWVFPDSTENIIGFRAYLNDQMIGETLESTDRQMECLTEIMDGSTFTMSVLYSDGTEIEFSNDLLYDTAR